MNFGSANVCSFDFQPALDFDAGFGGLRRLVALLEPDPLSRCVVTVTANALIVSHFLIVFSTYVVRFGIEIENSGLLASVHHWVAESEAISGQAAFS